MVRRCLIDCVCVLVGGTANAGDLRDDLARAYGLAYNLDHDAAGELFEAAIATEPDNPAAHRGLAAMTWMRVLFLRGTMTVDDYLGSVTPKNVDLPEPPAEPCLTTPAHHHRFSAPVAAPRRPVHTPSATALPQPAQKIVPALSARRTIFKPRWWGLGGSNGCARDVVSWTTDGHSPPANV